MTTSPAPEPLLLSPKSTAKALGLGLTKTWELIGKGELRARKIGRLTMVERASIAAFLDRLPPARPEKVA